MAERFFFVSYARSDLDRVRPIVEAIRRELQKRNSEVDVWLDLDRLQAGERWAITISSALREAAGLLVFISPASMRSDWVRREIERAVETQAPLIIPVVLEHVPELPHDLAQRQWVDLTLEPSAEILQQVAERIAQTADRASENRSPPLTSVAEATRVATELATEKREYRASPGGKDAIFIVHGHDAAALEEVEAFVAASGIKPLVLSRIGGPSQSLLQKFLALSTASQFAIVVLGADDLGASRRQYEAIGVGDRALKFRARQNVILELGYFFGLLGWENVFVLIKTPDKVFPDLEFPSDLHGVVFDQLDPKGEWRALLLAKLSEAGFAVDPSSAKEH